ncbi:hypothetical protein ACHHYP_05119 [Achlya hypogyna]|uniref:PH domain-containing protein n=1 Tax=Achlya hypogyna TaxID=1202772 RepID=A0A1V9YZ51_ACHHY|nr:hypothetical protein ACHHYP_05119 [Achlya hypogyna]
MARMTSHSAYTMEATATATRTTAEHCGWLWMRSSIIGRWRQRYFNLSLGMLSYFDAFPSEEFLKQAQALQTSISHLTHVEGSQPRGVLRVAHVEETNHRLGFKVYGTNGKVVEVRAPRSDERQAWLLALRPAAVVKSRSWSGHDGHAPQLYQYDDETSKVSSPELLHSSTIEVPLHGFAGRESIPIDKRGWFLKRSDILRRWNRYFFVIQGRMLSYYTTDRPYDVPRRRGYIQSVRRLTNKTHGGVLFLVRLDSGTELHLRASNGAQPDEMDEWFECLMANAIVYQSEHSSLPGQSSLGSVGSTSSIV